MTNRGWRKHHPPVINAAVHVVDASSALIRVKPAIVRGHGRRFVTKVKAQVDKGLICPGRLWPSSHGVERRRPGAREIPAGKLLPKLGECAGRVWRPILPWSAPHRILIQVDLFSGRSVDGGPHSTIADRNRAREVIPGVRSIPGVARSVPCCTECPRRAGGEHQTRCCWSHTYSRWTREFLASNAICSYPS
jgi:hypothetical protein